MKTLRYIGLALLTVVLSANFTACSDDDDGDYNAVKKIHVETAGSLSTLITAEEATQITDLTLSGYINGTDVNLIKKMIGLKRVDFTGLHIVGGGEHYDYAGNYPNYDYYYTHDNIFPAKCFWGFQQLSEIKLPNSITEIGEFAFKDCAGLASVEILNGVTKIGECAFYGCGNLASVKIPNSVTEIGSRAFTDCTELTSVEISNSITGLDDIFTNCASLTHVKIPNGVTKIQGTFEACTSLISVEIPNSVTVIDWGAFNGCTSLASIEIPNSVTKIGSATFNSCSALKEVHIKSSTPPDVAEYAFSTYAYVTLYVPVGSKNAYMQHEIWGKFGNIIEE